MKSLKGATFQCWFRKWKVVNYDDTDEMYICQSTQGDTIYVSSHWLEENSEKIGLDKSAIL